MIIPSTAYIKNLQHPRPGISCQCVHDFSLQHSRAQLNVLSLSPFGAIRSGPRPKHCFFKSSPESHVPSELRFAILFPAHL